MSAPDVTCAVSIGEADLMGQNRSLWLCSTVYEEIVIQLHPAVDRIYVDLQHVGASAAHIRVKLLVPGCEEGVGDIQATPVQTAIHKPFETPAMQGP